MYQQIIVIGSIAYDEIMNFPGRFLDNFHTEMLHQINVSFVVDKLEKQIGGTGTNIAYNLSRVTSSQVKLVGAVGKDGGEIIEFLESHNIDHSNVVKDRDLYTSTGKVITDKKDNQIWGYYYGAAAKAVDIDLKTLIDGNSVAILAPTHPDAFYKFQYELIFSKIDYMYDPGMTLGWIKPQILKQGILNSKWLIGNDYEIAMILKKSGLTKKDILSSDTAVITTLGDKGVMYEDPKTKLTVPAERVNLVDPTGAGDAWRGGFIGSLVENKPLEECLARGNYLASLAVQRYGTVRHSLK